MHLAHAGLAAAGVNPQHEINTERGERPAAPPESAAGILLILAALVIGGVVAAWVWRSPRTDLVAPPLAVPSQPASVAQAPASMAAAPASGPKYPLAEAAEASLQREDVPAALANLLGARTVASFLQTEDFARRVVATIDSLGRSHSPTAAWPVRPTEGRFTVEERPDGPVIAADNAARYTPFVLLAGTLDVGRAVKLYRRMYPLLQQAYGHLGFGDRYLNDRVIEVIDLLLATPEPDAPPRLQLTEVRGPVPSTRPWERYQFADPELEALAAGQKILVRVGPVNERRLKAKLTELREHIVSGGAVAATLPSAPASAAPAPVPAAAR